jgi:HSP20 family protein
MPTLVFTRLSRLLQSQKSLKAKLTCPFVRRNCFLSSEEKKKKLYYSGKEKKASEIRKVPEQSIAPIDTSDFQRDFDRMMDQFRRDFEGYWGIPHRHRHRIREGFGVEPSRGMMTTVDLEDRGKDFRLTADLPGFSKDDVDIQVTDDAVIIQALKVQAQEETKKNYLRQERTEQSFYRQVPLPETVKCDDAQAKLDNGVLEIILPKKQPKKTRKLKVS